MPTEAGSAFFTRQAFCASDTGVMGVLMGGHTTKRVSILQCRIPV